MSVKIGKIAEEARIFVKMRKLNGDLYNVAEIDGYDPLGKNQATLKLIRKIT